MVSYICVWGGSAPPTQGYDLPLRTSWCQIFFPLHDCHYALVGGALPSQEMKGPDFIDQLPTTCIVYVYLPLITSLHNLTRGGHPLSLVMKLPLLVHLQMSLYCERALQPCVCTLPLGGQGFM